MADYEKLGVFYLGRRWDPKVRKTLPELLLYDSKDLTTHGVCVGMTGSGKTGLCIGLLEEAAIDGIPALAIDPKGNLANLALTFPALSPADFLPWVDPDEAKKQGFTPAQLAEKTAVTWKKGLADWDEDGARIARFREACEVAIYTPASKAGRPLALLRALTAPPQAVLDDEEALRARVQGAVSGLLALAGIESDPMQGREHILLSQLVQRAWSGGHDLDLAGLIRGNPAAVVRQGRGPGPRVLLPGEGPGRTRSRAQQRARLSGGRRMGRGRAARHPEAAVDRRGEAAHRGPLHRAPLGRAADVLRHDAPQRGLGMDADAIRHGLAACAGLHG